MVRLSSKLTILMAIASMAMVVSSEGITGYDCGGKSGVLQIRDVCCSLDRKCCITNEYVIVIIYLSCILILPFSSLFFSASNTDPRDHYKVRCPLIGIGCAGDTEITPINGNQCTNYPQDNGGEGPGW
jgi:hypothetical protein